MRTILRVPDLRQQVYEAMRENIRLGRYPSDARFLENSVAKEFGVSRTPAREALALLEQDGLIAQEGRGFRFPKVDLAEIMDVYEVRFRLEPFAIRLAVERSTDAQLRTAVESMRRELKKHGEDNSYVQANRRIRDALFKLTRNDRLIDTIQSHEDYTQYVRTHTLNVAAIRATSVAGMHRLADAIEKRDVDAAEAAMTDLLEAAREAIVQHIEAEATRR
jgi:DNA-binding GntR family transcriptional regulator